MALNDGDINTVLDLFSQRCLDDSEFAKMAEENPIAAFDMVAQAHQAAAAEQEGKGFPLAVPGRKLTPEELREAKGL